MDGGRRGSRQRRAAGGIRRQPGEVAWAAELCVLGLPGFDLLRSDDPTELLVAQVTAEHLAELREQERKAFAVEIVNALGKALEKK